MIRRILALTHARNVEFIRDRAALSWNILFPLLLVLGLGLAFGSGGQAMFQVGVVSPDESLEPFEHPLLEMRYIDFFAVAEREGAVRKVGRHRMDMLVDFDRGLYWVNTTNPRGYFLDQLLKAAWPAAFERKEVGGEAVDYVDWLVPGILGMNIMFSSLYGVGYGIVRYRKNGYLKRLNATPLGAFEFICAQLISRLILVMVVTALVFVGTSELVGLPMAGRYLDLALVALLGSICLIALGLVMAARISSEELAGGVLNLLAWPMMLLSGVWFSMEGSPEWMQQLTLLLPLTHLLAAARAIILDGAGLGGVAEHMLALAGMTLLFLLAGTRLFRWSQG